MLALSQLFLSTLILVPYAAAQSLLAAIAGYPRLSDFTTLLQDNPNLAQELLGQNGTSYGGPITVLVPSNEAFQREAALFNVPYSELTIRQLEPYLQYHFLLGKVTSDNLTTGHALTVPTYLTDPLYNNRTAGQALGSDGSKGDPHNGQVVILKSKTASQVNGRLALRQLSDPTATVQGGYTDTINLTAINGQWSGGYFQIVDSFLTLPYICTETFRRQNQTALLRALNRTGLAGAVNAFFNLTCLGPTDQAFIDAGSPEINANLSTLQDALLLHTVTEPTYSSLLEDGQTFQTANNATVKVSIKGGSIYFNDAKVIRPNVITNNGLMHVLDRVMSPMGGSGSSPPSGNSGGSVTTASAKPSSTSASAATAVTVAYLPASSFVLATLLLVSDILF